MPIEAEVWRRRLSTPYTLVTAYIDPKQFVHLNVADIVDNVDRSCTGGKRVVFLVISSVDRMVISTTWLKG